MNPKGVVLAAAQDPEGAPAALDRGADRHLQPIANRPILLHAVEGMRNAGIRDVAVVASPSTRDAIRDALDADPVLGVEVELLVDRRPRGPVSAVEAASEFVAGHPFLLQPGDGLLRHDPMGVLDAVGEDSPDAIALIGRDPDGRVPPGLDLVDEPWARELPQTWSRGAQILGSSFFHRTHGHLERHRFDASLHGLFEDLKRDGGRVEARLVRWWSRFDGDPRALLRMNRVVLDDLDPGTVVAPHSCDVEGRVLIHPDARVEGTVIRGPVVIGPGATILDAYIGPYTAIGDNALVENAEIENSVVFAGAQIRHIGGRLDGSVIGRGAQVFRDFGVPRAVRLHVGDGAQVEFS
jgi:glucose-1-phosphate thymidylyltransferase